MKNKFLIIKPYRYEDYPSGKDVFDFIFKKTKENPLNFRFYCLPEFTKSQYFIKIIDEKEKTPNILFFFIRSFQEEFVTIKFKRKKIPPLIKRKIYLVERGSFEKSSLLEYDLHSLDSYGEHKCGTVCFLKEKSKLYHSMKTSS